MKAYDIALFLVCFLFACNFFTVSQVFGTTGVYYGDIANTICNSTSGQCSGDLSGGGIAPQKDEALSYPELAISAFGLLVRSLIAIVLVLSYSTFLLPLFLSQLGLPGVATAPITMIVWMAYIVGYAQYRARSTLQGTE
jgi:hypothetical protein